MTRILKPSLIAGFFAVAIWALIRFFWQNSEIRFGVALGLALSWGISTLSLSLLMSLMRSTMKKFLWAWLGGIGFRLVALVGLMALSWHWAQVTQAALLLSYAFGVLLFMTMEIRPLVVRESVA